MQTKIVDMYIKKQYQLTMDSFYTFVHQKSKLDSYQTDLIKEKVKEFGIGEQFDREGLRFLIRLMTGVQLYGGKVKGMGREELAKMEGNFNFKGKQKVEKQMSVKANRQQEDSLNSQSKYTKVVSETQIQTKDEQRLQEQQKPVQTRETTTQKKQQKKVQQLQQQHQQQQKPQQKPQESLIPTKLQQRPSSQKRTKPHPQNLSIIKQIENSTEINLTPKHCQLPSGPSFLNMSQSQDLTHRVTIRNYQKVGVEYVNPVIKYTIQYQKHRVARRFSDFQKLINLLKVKYEGCVLARLPPKEGLKAGINYFWGIDEEFLEERRRRLEVMLNKLVGNRFVGQDPTLKRFLIDPGYEIESGNKEDYVTYLKSLTDVMLNAKQLKDYGVAYCNYLRDKGTYKLHPQIEKKYLRIVELIEVFTLLNTYRKRVNTNHDKRRQLLHQLGIESRSPCNPKFDMLMDNIQQDIEDLNQQIENYKQLKSQQSWIHELIRQKQGDGLGVVSNLMGDREKVEGRLKRIEGNLGEALEEFLRDKVARLAEASGMVMGWREGVHP